LYCPFYFNGWPVFNTDISLNGWTVEDLESVDNFLEFIVASDDDSIGKRCGDKLKATSIARVKKYYAAFIDANLFAIVSIDEFCPQ
jgi:hypothetical protein